MKRTFLALCFMAGFAGSASAATMFDYDHVDPDGTSHVISETTINGVWLSPVDAALWSTDGVPFDLSSTTFKIDYPWAPVAPIDDPATAWNESQTVYRILGYRNGVEVARSESEVVWDEFGTHVTTHNTLGWGEVATRNLNWTNLDLVTWHSGARSDGTFVQVLAMSGAGITAAVPEPETYAMMIAGLGMTALAARRRKRG